MPLLCRHGSPECNRQIHNYYYYNISGCQDPRMSYAQIDNHERDSYEIRIQSNGRIAIGTDIYSPNSDVDINAGNYLALTVEGNGTN